MHHWPVVGLLVLQQAPIHGLLFQANRGHNDTRPLYLPACAKWWWWWWW